MVITIINQPLKMNLLISTTCMSPPPRLLLREKIPISISQRMTSCALPKTKPAGEDFQSTPLQSTDDDNEQSLIDI